MGFWDEFESAVRERGVRVEERLALLQAIGEELDGEGDPASVVKERRDAAVDGMNRAASALVQRARS